MCFKHSDNWNHEIILTLNSRLHDSEADSIFEEYRKGVHFIKVRDEAQAQLNADDDDYLLQSLGEIEHDDDGSENSFSTDDGVPDQLLNLLSDNNFN